MSLDHLATFFGYLFVLKKRSLDRRKKKYVAFFLDVIITKQMRWLHSWVKKARKVFEENLCDYPIIPLLGLHACIFSHFLAFISVRKVVFPCYTTYKPFVCYFWHLFALQRFSISN